MCFAPQWRALFRHLNFQKWSGAGVLCTFWLRNVLRATTACTFSTSQLPKVVRGCILTSKCSSRHNRATPAALASLLFDPPEPQIIGKTQCFATFLPFRAPGSSFFWDFLFFDLLSSSLLFSDSSHLCFSSVHIVGSLTSKLPSVTVPPFQDPGIPIGCEETVSFRPLLQPDNHPTQKGGGCSNAPGCRTSGYLASLPWPQTLRREW